MRICLIIGTRPEAIKMAPIALVAKDLGSIDCHICFTGQHAEMARTALSVFGLQANSDLNVMIPGQSLSTLTANLVQKLDGFFAENQFDVVLVQGDTTSAFVAGLVGFYHRIPVGHIEAGLRTGNLQSPFPEEANRSLIGRLANWHFAPTLNSSANLRTEGVPEGSIFVTGNTVVDAVEWLGNRESFRYSKGKKFDFLDRNSPVVFVTQHRRENHGDPLQHVCQALIELADNFSSSQFVFPVHPNPAVKEVIHESLGQLKNVFLLDPIDFDDSIYLQSISSLIITDSGGIQEEAPSFGVPVLVTREHTERMEGVESGCAMLVGTDQGKIVENATSVLSAGGKRDADISNPYGDGAAAKKILEILETVV
ncbi:MAG: UDP-N-acetylglucosamine 2-epimerase (non-hydrolyzing) [Verrucomicrobiales bacterium]|nr:UDP-N-acetylglucosamine 2-epimerase (non-hydrolyzing) [Verrucomicrobiales bacterium]